MKKLARQLPAYAVGVYLATGLMDGIWSPLHWGGNSGLPWGPAGLSAQHPSLPCRGCAVSLYSLTPITREELERHCTQDNLVQFVSESFLSCRSLMDLPIDVGSNESADGGFPSAKVADVAAVFGALTSYTENRLETVAQLIDKNSAEKITVHSKGEVFCSLPQALEIG